jgi:hypothetical protein
VPVGRLVGGDGTSASSGKDEKLTMLTPDLALERREGGQGVREALLHSKHQMASFISSSKWGWHVSGMAGFKAWTLTLGAITLQRHASGTGPLGTRP